MVNVPPRAFLSYSIHIILHQARFVQDGREGRVGQYLLSRRNQGPHKRFIYEFLGFLVPPGHGLVLLVVDTAALDGVAMGRRRRATGHLVIQERGTLRWQSARCGLGPFTVLFGGHRACGGVVKLLWPIKDRDPP